MNHDIMTPQDWGVLIVGVIVIVAALIRAAMGFKPKRPPSKPPVYRNERK